MTSGTEVGAGGEPTRVTRRTSSNTVANPESVVITSEIPLVSHARPRRIGAQSETWFEKPERRTPAPVALQIVVWLLFVLAVVGGAGLAVVHFHSSWLGFLRNGPARSSTAGSSSHSTTPSKTGSTTAPSGFALTSSSGSGATYSVPSSSSYEVLVTVSNACYVEVKSPPKSSHIVYAKTIAPSKQPTTIPLTGSTSLTLAARADSLDVEVGSKRVGTISPPKSFFTYTFVPSGR